MSRAFISGALLALLLLQGCSSNGLRPRASAPGDGAAGAADQPTVPEPVPADREPLPARPVPPAPPVQERNRELFARATELLLDHRLVEAEALLLELTSDQPELAGPWVNLARVYLAQQREEEAVDALERAVLANPANCAARTELGVLLRRQGAFARAEAQYLGCLTYRPDYRPAHLNLGILYDLYLGRLDEALDAYRRYQSLAAEPDRRVHGWMVDLERRLGS